MQTSFDNEISNPSDLAEVFHENTKEKGSNRHMPSIDRQDLMMILNSRKKDFAFPEIKLQEIAHPQNWDLIKLLEKRSSAKSFSGTPISLSDLSILLQLSFGSQKRNIENPYARKWPSAGGMYPLQAYVVIAGMHNTSPCVARYDSISNSLRVIAGSAEAAECFKFIYGAGESCKNPSLAIFLSAEFWKTKRKYGERGYRYCLLDAGHVGQNFMLVSTALGLPATPIGSYDEPALENIFGLDGLHESLVHAMIFEGASAS